MVDDLDTLVGETSELGTGPASAEPLTLLATGATLGRYLVLERLGMGGMGVVYAAYDPQLDRKVAIKLVRPHAGGGSVGDVRARLLREAQAMAKLSHPNVVAVHDVGTVDGQIFVAMEYIDGPSLRAWLDAEPRGWAEVLAVMRDAGRGLAAAHALGLVHRDFKPDNVMLGKHGPVVMDFGLVRSELSPTEVEAPRRPDFDSTPVMLDSMLTEVGSVLGTPAYMAPEQLAGAEVDARSDQFSFCVTLYEALYGRRPFTGRTVAELAAAVMDGAIEAEPHDRQVPRWLRAVVLRGLATEPNDRFATMDELLAALARNPSVRRRAFAVVGGVVLLGLATVGFAARASRLEDARARAQCEAAGRAIDEVWNPQSRGALGRGLRATGSPFADAAHERMLAWLDPWAARWAEERTELCVRAEIDEQLGEAAYTQASACFDEQRLRLVALLEAFATPDARMVAGAAKAAAAFSQLESCADERVIAQRPAIPADLLHSDERERVVRFLARASALSDAGDYVEAFAFAREAETEVLGLDWVPLEAEARLTAASIRSELGDYQRVVDDLRAAYKLAVRSGSDALAAKAAIMLLRVYGYHLAQTGEGLAWADVAEALLDRLGRSQGLDAAQLSNNVALVHEVLGDYRESERWHVRALELRTRALSADHPETGHSLANLGNLALRRNDLDAALRWHRQALEVRSAGLGPNHPDVGRSHANTGRVLLARGEYDEALAQLQASLEIFEATFGRRHRVCARVLDNLGRVHRERGDYLRARADFDEALDIQLALLGDHHHETAQTLLDLGLLELALGDHEAALANIEAAASAFEAGLGVGHAYADEVADAFARLCSSGHAASCGHE